MSTIKDFANLTIGLSVNPTSLANFGITLKMVDHEDIPIDKRYRTVTRLTYATDLTADSHQYNWCSELWNSSHTKPAENAYIGRWVKTASSPYVICPNPETTISDWVAVASAGSLTVTDGTNDDILTGLVFGSVTDLDDVATVIETALQGIASPNITGLDTATVEVDGYGRIIIKNSTTGASAAGITLAATATGTDIAVAGLLGADTYGQDGLDAESLYTSTAAVLALDNTPFVLTEYGASVSEQVAFATATNALDKITILVTNAVDSKLTGTTTDLGYQLEALGLNRCYLPYSEWSDQYPDAGICGEIFPQKEATLNFALTPIAGLTKSGKATDGTSIIPIDAASEAVLKAKGYDYLVKPATQTHFVTGLAPGGVEVRIMFAKMFCEARVNEDVYNYLLANNVVTFSDDDINAIKGIVEYWLTEMEDRKVLEAGWEVTMPLAEDFTAAQKATHILDLDDISAAETQRAVNKVNLSLSWSV